MPAMHLFPRLQLLWLIDLPALSALSSEQRIRGRWDRVTQQSRRVEDLDDGPI